MAEIISVDLFEKPSKLNIEEPLISPMRKNLNGADDLQKFVQWRMHRRHFKVRADWVVWVEYLDLWVKIPAGFVFDGASVPKIFHSILNSVDSVFYGSILHDFIYRTNQLIVCTDEEYGNWYIKENMTKQVADRVMLNFTEQMEGSSVPSSLAYYVLYSLGWIAWNSARKQNYHLLTAYPSETNSVLNYYN
jgi:hypothetical protein